MPLLRLLAIEFGLSFMEASAASLHIAHCALMSILERINSSMATGTKICLQMVFIGQCKDTEGYSLFVIGYSFCVYHNPERGTRNPEPETRNPKQETRNKK